MIDLHRIAEAGEGLRAEAAFIATLVAAFDEEIADALSCMNNDEAIARIEERGLTKTADQLRQARARGQLISIRTRSGLAKAKSSGRKGGRPPRLSPDRMAELLEQWDHGNGKNPTELAELFDVGRTTVYRVIQGALGSSSNGSDSSAIRAPSSSRR